MSSWVLPCGATSSEASIEGIEQAVARDEVAQVLEVTDGCAGRRTVETPGGAEEGHRRVGVIELFDAASFFEELTAPEGIGGQDTPARADVGGKPAVDILAAQASPWRRWVLPSRAPLASTRTQATSRVAAPMSTMRSCCVVSRGCGSPRRGDRLVDEVQLGDTQVSQDGGQGGRWRCDAWTGSETVRCCTRSPVVLYLRQQLLQEPGSDVAGVERLVADAGERRTMLSIEGGSRWQTLVVVDVRCDLSPASDPAATGLGAPCTQRSSWSRHAGMGSAWNSWARWRGRWRARVRWRVADGRQGHELGVAICFVPACQECVCTPEIEAQRSCQPATSVWVYPESIVLYSLFLWIRSGVLRGVRQPRNEPVCVGISSRHMAASMGQWLLERSARTEGHDGRCVAVGATVRLVRACDARLLWPSEPLGSPHVIYGADDRQEWFEVSDPAALAVAMRRRWWCRVSSCSPTPTATSVSRP